jgi:hypothetical protein
MYYSLQNKRFYAQHQSTPPGGKDAFASSYALHLEAVNGVHMITMSGIVILDLDASQMPKRRTPTHGWRYSDLYLELALPPNLLTPGMALHVEQCAPFITVNAVGGISTVGWAVDEFSGPGKSVVTESIQVKAVLGVYSTGEVLHRIGYNVTAVGTIQSRLLSVPTRPGSGWQLCLRCVV